MNGATVIRYLLGNRQAIREITHCPAAVWVGLLFVLSAGLAREYDGEDLLHEPWHTLLPLGVSLVTSLALFLLAKSVFASGYLPRARIVSFAAQYRQFLSLYWMTAPLAWLYALPVERFLEPHDAVRVNLSLLGVVSLWRVLLMSRVLSVLHGRPVYEAATVVMLFADTVAVGVMMLTPLPVFAIMGGIRLTESEILIQTTTFLVWGLGILSWPIWAIGTAIVAALSRKRKPPSPETASSPETGPSPEAPRGVTAPLWVGAFAAVLVWIAILPLTQPEQIHRRYVERAMRTGQIQDAVRYMSQRKRSDFPPHWDPPPRVGYGEEKPSPEELIWELDPERGAAAWVRDMYFKKIIFHGGPVAYLKKLEEVSLARYLRILQASPYGPQMARLHHFEIETALGEETKKDAEPLSDSRRRLMEQLQAMGNGDSSPVGRGNSAAP